jgi:hypothetical protein
MTASSRAWSNIQRHTIFIPVEQPEIFKAPGGAGSAWGGGGAWSAARPGNQTTMSDGQAFTVGLSKALYQYNQSAKKS